MSRRDIARTIKDSGYHRPHRKPFCVRKARSAEGPLIYASRRLLNEDKPVENLLPSVGLVGSGYIEIRIRMNCFSAFSALSVGRSSGLNDVTGLLSLFSRKILIFFGQAVDPARQHLL